MVETNGRLKIGVILVRSLCRFILVPAAFHLAYKGYSPHPDTKGEGKFMPPSQREIYALLLGRQEEDRELFLHLLTLRCPQMKIIFVSK